METFRERMKQILSQKEIRGKILSALREQHLSLQPTLSLSLSNLENVSMYLNYTDLYELLSAYGPLELIEINSTGANIQFKDVVSAYFAQETLNGQTLGDSSLTLVMRWNQLLPSSALFRTISPNMHYMAKHTCRYEIQIPNDNEFQVARRLIGARGTNMKRIIETCLPLDCRQPHELIKLRLRGQGSGFKEGLFRVESSEPLHLCVSSRIYQAFVLACQEIERLLKEIYREYEEFAHAKGSVITPLKICKFEKFC